MDNLFAFLIIAIALVYSDLADGGFFLGFVLPVLGVLSAYHLLRIVGSAILLAGAVIYHFIDITSTSVFFSVVLPLMLGLTVIMLGIWLWKQDHTDTSSGWVDPGNSGGGFGGGDCGGDGGNC